MLLLSSRSFWRRTKNRKQEWCSNIRGCSNCGVILCSYDFLGCVELDIQAWIDYSILKSGSFLISLSVCHLSPRRNSYPTAPCLLLISCSSMSQERDLINSEYNLHFESNQIKIIELGKSVIRRIFIRNSYPIAPCLVLISC